MAVSYCVDNFVPTNGNIFLHHYDIPGREPEDKSGTKNILCSIVCEFYVADFFLFLSVVWLGIALAAFVVDSCGKDDQGVWRNFQGCSVFEYPLFIMADVCPIFKRGSGIRI